ncbi:type II toxin-antitoxin system RelE family toxin [Candidatus Poriferisodalis sp.]|uniref:type II toxin-antitoxin system RelE family toxin n=1 Tax=Candidatus Poriferisodalis sp. TaxID=3101277 RepID=UPI003B515B91
MPELSRSAAKSLRGLPELQRKRAIEITSRLDQDPALGRKLQGQLRVFRSARMGRSHRVIYRVSSGIIRVTAISPRKDAYR